jgi:sugar phosphate isomerase/epimerase
MYKNLSPSALGVSGRQSELIELTLTYGFRSLDLDAGELLKRASLQGVEDATRYIRSGKVKVGGWVLPVDLAADDEAFSVEVEKLASLGDTAVQVGFTYCTATIDPGSDDLPFHENFERHRERLATIGDVLGRHGVRLAVGFKAAAGYREGRNYPFIHQAEEMLTLIKTITSDNVGLALDTWNWKVGGGGNDQLGELTGGQVVTVGIADVPVDADLSAVDETQRLFPNDETFAENGALLTGLAERGYDGPVTLYPHPAQFSRVTREISVERCAGVLNRIWNAAGLNKAGKLAPTPVEG